MDTFSFVTFLNTYSDATYHAPNKTVNPTEKKIYETILSNSRIALEDFGKFVYNIGIALDMYGFRHIGFLHGSNIKVRNYMWGELRDNDALSLPESISIFIEKYEDMEYPSLRISLEIDEKRASKEILKLHNDTLLTSTLPNGFQYCLNQTATKKIYSTDNKTEAKTLITDGKYKKVQICKRINIKSLSKDDILNQTTATIKDLIPLYKKLI